MRTPSVGVRGYAHDLDPYRFHPTKALAVQDRSRLLNLSGMKVPIKSRLQRETTLYTIMQDKRKSGSTKFGRTPQGPHIVPNWAIHHALTEAKETGKLHEFPVLTPNQYQRRLSLEIPSTHAKSAKATQAVNQYQKNFVTYSALKSTRKRDEAQEIKFAHTINKMLQLDPFGTSGFKGSGAKASSLRGKGEKSTQPVMPQIDWPKTPFNDNKGFNTHVNRLLSTLGKYGVK